MRLLLSSVFFLVHCIVLVQPLWAEPSQASTPPPATGVFVAEVRRVPFSDQVEAIGTLQAKDNVNLTSSVTERVSAIYFEDNQRVSKGDLLLEMDASQEQAEYAEESSRLREAQRQVQRIRELVKRGSASEATLDERENELNTAKARVTAIESRINERRILAPFDGIVGFKNISVGALAQPGTLITTIDDTSQMKLDFSVPEVYLSSLKQGLPIQALASAYPAQTFPGTVTSIDSRVDTITRSIRVRALLDNNDALLKAGMLMRVQLQKNQRSALIVPEEAILTRGNENAVLVVAAQDGITVAQKQVVSLGARKRGIVEVLNGLTEGQQVITHGTVKVQPGSPVSVKAVEQDSEHLTQLLNQASAESQQGVPQAPQQKPDQNSKQEPSP